MTIYGKEVKLLFTVDAYFKIAELCPDKDIARLTELLDDKVSSLQKIIDLAVIMSECYCNAQRYINPFEVEETKPLTRGELLTISPTQIAELGQLVTRAIVEGNSTEIRTETEKKTEVTR